MSSDIAFIAGEEVHRQWEAGRITGERIGPRATPFGDSGGIIRVEGDSGFYLLARHAAGLGKPAPRNVNSRANLYALKDLGVQTVLDWGPGGAITHTVSVGDLVILSDLVDLTYRRETTFFEDSPLGYLRQFPVFCPKLSCTLAGVLDEMRLVYHGRGTAAVCEGPRFETPAEVRRLATIGAGVATFSFVPEAFLAKELQMCYAAVCYMVNYAEMGSRHRPFVPNLFGGLSQQPEQDRLATAVGAMSRIADNLVTALDATDVTCQCARSMAENVRHYELDEDWRTWFDAGRA